MTNPNPNPNPNDTITLSLTQLAAIIRSEITHQLSRRDDPSGSNVILARGAYCAALRIAESQIGTPFNLTYFLDAAGKHLLSPPSNPSNPNESAS